MLTNGVGLHGGRAAVAPDAALPSSDGRIVALGSAAEAADGAGPRTRTVDLGGRLVLPGLSTRTCIRSSRSASSSKCDWPTAADRRVPDRVARFAAERPELPAIRGGGWYPTMVPMEAG